VYFAGDPDAPDEALDYDEKYFVEQLNEGCFLSRCDIPASLFSQIIGSKGSTKKRIETETNTRITVPRQGEKGDIVVRGQSAKDVKNARRRLETIVHQARMKRDPTHFACFPLNYPTIIESSKKFKVLIVIKNRSTHIFANRKTILFILLIQFLSLGASLERVWNVLQRCG